MESGLYNIYNKRCKGTDVLRSMRILLHRYDFWGPASKGVDKGELAHLPTDLRLHTEKQTHIKTIELLSSWFLYVEST